MGFGKDYPTRITHPRPLLCTWPMLIDADLHRLAEAVFVKLFHCKVPYPPALSQGNPCRAHPEGMGSHAPSSSSREQCVHPGDLALSPPLLLSAITYLGQYGRVDIHCVRWVIMQDSCIDLLALATRRSCPALFQLWPWGALFAGTSWPVHSFLIKHFCSTSCCDKVLQGHLG